MIFLPKHAPPVAFPSSVGEGLIDLLVLDRLCFLKFNFKPEVARIVPKSICFLESFRGKCQLHLISAID